MVYSLALWSLDKLSALHSVKLIVKGLKKMLCAVFGLFYIFINDYIYMARVLCM